MSRDCQKPRVCVLNAARVRGASLQHETVKDRTSADFFSLTCLDFESDGASTHDLFMWVRSARSQHRPHIQHPLENRLQLPPRARARYACVPRSRPSHTELWPHSCGCHNALAIISAARTSARRPAVIVVTTASLRAASVFRRSSPPHSEHPHHHPSCDDGRLLHSRSFYNRAERSLARNNCTRPARTRGEPCRAPLAACAASSRHSPFAR